MLTVQTIKALVVHFPPKVPGLSIDYVLRKGEPLPGPETGLLSNIQKWIVGGDTCADKAWDSIGKGRPGGEQEGKGTQENCSAA